MAPHSASHPQAYQWQLDDLQSALDLGWHDAARPAAWRQAWSLRLLEVLAESPAALRALGQGQRGAGIPAADWRRLAAAALASAPAAGGDPAYREWLAREPRCRASGGPDSPKRPVAPSARLTVSQKNAYEKIWSWSHLFFSGRGRAGQIRPRTSALLVGASGVGKSHLVRQFAAEAGLGYLRLTYGDWLPRGAKQEPTTFDTIRLFLLQHRRAVIFIDELDKLSAGLEGGWSTSVKNDIYALLDRSWFDGVPGRGGRAEQELKAKLADSVYFVAAGTWQDLWHVAGGARPPVGFGARSNAATPPDISQRVRAARAIPTELLNRFNGDLLVLAPMGPDDFRAIVVAAGLDREAVQAGIGIDYDEAVNSGLGFRWVENLACRVYAALAEAPAAAAVAPDPAEVNS